MAVYYRSDQARIGVEVTGLTLDKESWDVLEGGDQVVEGVTLLPGGMAPQVARGGIPKRSAITVKRLWSESLINLYKKLDESAGNAPITVTYTVLNNRNSATTFTITYTGVLENVSRPNYDATKAEAAYLTITAQLEGGIT